MVSILFPNLIIFPVSQNFKKPSLIFLDNCILKLNTTSTKTQSTNFLKVNTYRLSDIFKFGVLLTGTATAFPLSFFLLFEERLRLYTTEIG